MSVTPFYEDAAVKLYLSDCLDLLASLPESSIDACVTDPPYGIGFMGKEWDTFKPGEEAKRIVPNRAIASDNPNLKGRTRGPASSPSAVEYDYSAKGLRAFQGWTEQWGREVFRVLKPGAHIVVCGAPRAYHRMAAGIEDAGFEIRDCFAWLFGSGFPKSLNLGEGLGTALKPAHEPIVLARKPFKGTVKANVEKYGTGALNIDACRINPGEWISGGGNGRPSEGASWQGSPRELVEPHDLGRWPANVVLDDLAAMVLDEQSGELGVSAGGRIGNACGGNVQNVPVGKYEAGDPGYGDSGGASRFYKVCRADAPRCDICGAEMLRDERNASDPADDVECGIQPAQWVCFCNGGNYKYDDDRFGARFLYVAKPSREERDMGCYGLRTRQRDESRDPDAPGANSPRNRGGQQRGNFHPTVKPVELMRWLVRLVTPPNGTVLDPFLGSGTTGMACRYEQRQFIGIEREAEYIAIAERRIRAVCPLFAEHSA